MDRIFMFFNFVPRGLSAPAPVGYIHVYDHNIQTSSPLKALGQSKPNYICGASLGRGNESLYKWSRSHDQDGRHGYK